MRTGSCDRKEVDTETAENREFPFGIREHNSQEIRWNRFKKSRYDQNLNWLPLCSRMSHLATSWILIGVSYPVTVRRALRATNGLSLKQNDVIEIDVF